jgi:peptide/nickel transport system permease protein
MPNVTPLSSLAVSEALVAHAAADATSWRRALATLGRDPAARISFVVLAVIVVVAILAPWIAPYDPGHAPDIVRLKDRPPSADYWFGTDPYSRDVYSRVIHGARVSLSLSFLAVLLSSVVGLSVGAVAGYVGGIVDSALMRFVDACLSIPRILLLISVVALWGRPDLSTFIVVLGLTGWFGVSRLVRAEVLSLRERDFVTAARALGTGHARILVRHVVPHALAPVFVAAALGVGYVIIAEAGLSFLGYGVPEPDASWGAIIREGRDGFPTRWWLSVFPGLALVVTVLAFNTLADRLRAALNPRQLDAR